jgi:drug/metabolite transporter (DMT)-like permease
MFAFCVIVWGSSYWFAKNQAAFAPAEFSLLLRQIVALLFFTALYFFTKKQKNLKMSNYLDIGIFAICNFMLGYWLLYLSANSLSSGLVVVIFSFKSILTPILLVLKNNQKIKKSLICGALIAIIGILFLVYDSLVSGVTSYIGVFYACLGTIITSIGDVYSTKNNNNNIQPIYANFIGLILITPLMFVLNLHNGNYLTQLTNMHYLVSVVYLGVFASGIAWVFYLYLVKNIGAVYASYMVTLFPLIGCLVSIIFEGMKLTHNIYIGLTLETFGLLIAFTGGKFKLNKTI